MLSNGYSDKFEMFPGSGWDCYELFEEVCLNQLKHCTYDDIQKVLEFSKSSIRNIRKAWGKILILSEDVGRRRVQ